MKKRKTTIILLISFFIGLSVLLYPTVSSYWNSKTQTHAVDNYQDILNSLQKEDYTAYFEEADQYNAALQNLEVPLLEYGQLAEYNQILNVSGTGVMGYITIEKLGVELPLYHGTSDSVLNIACGHMEGTSLPVIAHIRFYQLTEVYLMQNSLPIWIKWKLAMCSQLRYWIEP